MYSKSNEQQDYDYTCSVSFYESQEYEEKKQSVKKKIGEFGLSEDTVVFNDQENRMTFKSFSEQEIAYIFNIGPTIRTKRELLLFQADTERDNKYNAYLEKENSKMIQGSKQYAELRAIKQSLTQPMRLSSSKPINTLDDLFKVFQKSTSTRDEVIKHLIISESHDSTESKKVIMSEASIKLLKERQGIVLLEHLCYESMQAELDKSVERKKISPLLGAYLKTLDKCQELKNVYGFYDLVKKLVENGIQVVAMDTHAAYAHPSTNDQESVSLERQMANIEWKKRHDDVRKTNPGSLIVSLIGHGHTSQYIAKWSYPTEVIGYDIMVAGNSAQWMADKEKSRIIYHQPNPLKFHSNPSQSTPQNNAIMFTQRMKSEFIFSSDSDERMESAKKIIQYASTPSAFDNSESFFIGRMPVACVNYFCEQFGINPENLTKIASSYKGKDKDNPIDYTGIALKKNDLDRILSSNPSQIGMSFEEIDKRTISLSSGRPYE